ncbi:MAG: DUF177 domain-containing protein [Pseudomonadota bacterium]
MLTDNIVTLKDVLKKREIEDVFTFSDQQKQDLIQECDLLDIRSLKADLKIYPIVNNKGIGVEAKIKADIIHPCVVTLGPVTQKIREFVFLRFVPENHEEDGHITHDSIYLNKKLDFYDTEELINDQIDLYNIIREHVVIALDPLPRVANAEFKGYTSGNLTEEERQIVEKNTSLIAEGYIPNQSDNPFSVLADLKKRM